MRTIPVLLILLALPIMVWSQRDITFLASTNAGQIVPGQVFSVQFKVSNAQVNRFEAPDFKYFEILSGPNRSSQVSIVNGRRSMSFTYSYNLVAEQAGTFTIPPATAYTEDGKLVSNSLEIEVVPAAQQPSGKGEEDFFLRLEVSNDSPYVGQQLLLDYVLYTKVNIERIYTLKDVELEGFYASPVQQYPSAVTQSSVNGQPYTRQIVSRKALFPQQSGQYEIGPLILRLDVDQENGSRPFSFFRNIVRKEATAPPVSIQVRPLPEPVVAGFSGGIGQYSIQARAVDQETEVGSAVELEVRVSGDGDPNVLDAPKLWINGPAESLEANLEYEDEQVFQGRRAFVKTYSYLIIPEESGKLEVTPTLITLDPKKGYYDTLKAEIIEFWANPKSENTAASEIEVLETEDSKQNSFWVYGIAAMAILISGFILFRRLLKGKAQGSTNHSNQGSPLLHEIQSQLDTGKPELNRIRQLLQEWLHQAPESMKTSIQSWIKEVDFQQFNPEKNTQAQLDLLRKIKEGVQEYR